MGKQQLSSSNVCVKTIYLIDPQGNMKPEDKREKNVRVKRSCLMGKITDEQRTAGRWHAGRAKQGRDGLLLSNLG